MKTKLTVISIAALSFLWAMPASAVAVNVNDPCSATFASAGGPGGDAECLPACGPGKSYDASNGVFTSNPCANVTGKARCCVGKSAPLCEFLAKLGGIDTSQGKVECGKVGGVWEAIASKTGGGATIGNSCSDPAQCVKQKPTCTEAVSKIAVTKTTAECAALSSGLENQGYFVIDYLLQQAKVPFACANTKCWAPKGDKGDGGYFCQKLGELAGVQGAKCYKDAMLCSDVVGDVTNVVPQTESYGDPCTDYSSFKGKCCGPKPPPSKAGPAGKGATSTKQVAPPPATITQFGLLNPLGSKNVPQIIGQITAWLGGLAGSLFFVYLLWGGAQWMFAGGDLKNAAAARGRILHAVFGIIIIMLAYILVQAVIGALSGG